MSVATAVQPPEAIVPGGRVSRGRIVGATLVACAAAIAMALFGPWFTEGGGSLALYGRIRCILDSCVTDTWLSVRDVPVHVIAAAYGTLIAGVAAVIMMAHGGAMLLVGAPHRVRSGAITRALAGAMLCASGFVVALSYCDVAVSLTVGWSLLVGLGGLVAAAITMALFVVRTPVISEG